MLSAALLLPPLRGDARRRGAPARARRRSRRGVRRRSPTAARSARRRARPRLPEVFGKPTMPRSSSSSSATPATRPRRGSRCAVRVEVDAQLVGVVRSSRRTGQGWNVSVPICAAHAGTATSVGQTSSAVRPDGERDGGGLDVVGRALGHPLLVERVRFVAVAGAQHDALVHALRPALQRRRPVAQRAHDAVGDRDVVLDDHQLGGLGRAVGRLVDDPVRAGHPHGAIARLRSTCRSRAASRPPARAPARHSSVQ